MFSLLYIKNIRHMLTMEACHTILLGLVISHLDYANAIIAELPDLAIKCFNKSKTWQISWSQKENVGIVLANVYNCYTGYPSDRGLHTKSLHYLIVAYTNKQLIIFKTSLKKYHIKVVTLDQTTCTRN